MPRDLVRDSKRIVIKLGTRVLTEEDNRLAYSTVASMVEQISGILPGRELIIVSSGAIALGLSRMGLDKRPQEIDILQAAAAMGQSRLMHAYEAEFAKSRQETAQILLTFEDIQNRRRYLNIRNTIFALWSRDAVPIVNENDTVSFSEIRFGDNDILSAMVANLVDADLLVMLTDTEGLYTADPYHDPKAKLIPEVGKIDAKIARLGALNTDDIGTGGMVTKIEAAKIATSSGVDVVVANGLTENVVTRLAAGEAIGTHFLPSTTRMESRKRWLLSGLSTRGKLIIDNGAATALKKQNRSLLSAGINHAEGKFSRGEIVAIYDTEDNHLGCGITNYSSEDIGLIKGAHSSRIASLLSVDYGPEVVHRNNLALLEGKETSDNRKTIPIH